MKLQFTWRQLLKIEGINQLEKNIVEYNGTCYEKCIKCKGSGNVPWGKCYDCNGWGIYGKESKEAYINRIESAKKRYEEYLQSDEYKTQQLQDEYMYLVKRLEEAENATDWERNFANSLYCRQYNKVSPKQKDILLKLSNKLHNLEQQIQFKQFVD